jgi:single-strand DNA-binding protein
LAQMASDLNKFILIGRLVRDPELRYTQGGTPVANFSIASNRSYTVNSEKKEIVSFFNCIAWNKLGEIIVQYCKKGNRIGIEGRLQQRSWEDQAGNKRSTVEVVTENFQFLTPRESTGGDVNVEAPPQDFNGSIPEMDSNPFSDDDIPF